MADYSVIGVYEDKPTRCPCDACITGPIYIDRNNNCRQWCERYLSWIAEGNGDPLDFIAGGDDSENATGDKAEDRQGTCEVSEVGVSTE